jgi:hypothetical protein
VAEEATLAREALVDTLSTFDDKVMERFLEHDSSLEGVPADMIAQVHSLSNILEESRTLSNIHERSSSAWVNLVSSKETGS